ncbi:Hypothetical predicted protein [Pelobates cultripes]|uniref:Uncharacterized protein n=1 Tax=Pelobates cultripes TaxID=61616 RepID=A0AAD1TCV0_PELCU|nr:Hypothetical predicted protein [Pelobates cultripes]
MCLPNSSTVWLDVESRLDSLFERFWQRLESRQLHHAPLKPKDLPQDLQAPDRHRESLLPVKKAQVRWRCRQHKQWSSPKLKGAHMLKTAQTKPKHRDKPEKQRRTRFLMYVLISRHSYRTKRLKHSFGELDSALPTKGIG